MAARNRIVFCIETEFLLTMQNYHHLMSGVKAARSKTIPEGSIVAIEILSE